MLTWAPHMKGLPMAVPHSAILAAAAAGMNVTIAHPPGYELVGRYVETVPMVPPVRHIAYDHPRPASRLPRGGRNLREESGSPGLYGQPDAQAASFREHAAWMVGLRHLHKPTTILMHCLPVRRNLVIADEALDDPRSAVIDEAENRLWAQAAVCMLLGRFDL